MRRREFITLLGGAAASWPLVASAQQSGRMRRIGVLMAFAESSSTAQAWVGAFRDSLAKFGWTEGRNLQIDYRWATPDANLITQSAKELVALAPDLILSSGSPTTAALQQLTRIIPIIFAIATEPVSQGFVASMARPGGNITGFINLPSSITGKYLELLREIAPRVTRVAIFFNPVTAPYFDVYVPPFKTAAVTMGVEPIIAPIRSMTELESVAAALAREPNGGLIGMPDGFNTARRVEITSLAASHQLPAVRLSSREGKP